MSRRLLFLRIEIRHRVSLALIFASLLFASVVRAQGNNELTADATALKWLPADVAIFGSNLRLKEQYDRLVSSNAFKKIAELPLVQLGWQQALGQWNNNDDPQLAMVKQLLEQPENKQLVELLKDAVSQEVFFCWDATLTEQMKLMQSMQGELLQLQLKLAEETGKDQLPPEELGSRLVNEMLKKYSDRIKFPSGLMGFKLSNPQAATAQLTRLEQLAPLLQQLDPSFAGRVKREPIAGGDFVTLSLDGSQIPWKLIRQQIAEQNGGDLTPEQEKLFEQLPPLVAKYKLQICVGIRDGYLLVSVGESASLLNRLGTGERLADRKELAPLKKAGAQRFTSIGFVDGQFLNSADSTSSTLNQYKTIIDQLGKIPGNDDTEENRKARELLKEFLDDLKAFAPVYSSISSYSVQTADGNEGFAFTWPKVQALDGAKPLGLLRHVGEQPLLAGVVRQKRTNDLAMFDKWLKRLEQAFLKDLITKLEGEQKAKAEQIYNSYMPLLKRFVATTKDVLLPSIADGQIGMVVDFQTTIPADIIPGLPPAREPLPIPEFALLFGVNDAAGVKKAFAQYSEQMTELLGKLKEQFPEQWGEAVFPEVKSRDFDEGTIYYVPFNAGNEVGKTFAANAGVGAKVGVLSAIPRFSKRLLEEHPLQVGGLLENLDRPLASAAVVNSKPLADFLNVWVDYGFSAYAKLADGAGNAFLPAVKGHVYELLNVLRCWKGTTTVTYFEGDMQVTRSRSIYQDLE